MAEIFGLILISLVSFTIILIGLRWPDISRILYVALSLRVLVILIGHYIVPLPDSTKDAAGLDDLAWSYGKDGFLNALSNFNLNSRYFHSQIIGIFYSLFGRSILISQSLSLIIGLGIIFLAWFYAKKIWDDLTAKKIAWILAIFPSQILYSVLPLKDIYMSFFLLIAMIGIFHWVKEESYKYLFVASAGFILATLFHGALVLGLIVFLSLIVLINFKNFFKSIRLLHLNISALIISILSIYILQIFFLNKIYIPKIGYFEDINYSLILNELNARMIGESSYGNWAIITGKSSIGEVFYKIILRMFYFLFSPFPWNIEKLSHIIGMIDGFVYLIIFYFILLNLKNIWKDPFLKIILIILICYIFIFALGVSNFGSALRHRTKFIVEMLILAGPLIPTFVLSNKGKLLSKLKNKS